MSSDNDSPLVSVVVITYNSSAFVLETLESIKIQKYKNLELIIADDSSKDDTVEICTKWLAENSEKFVDSKIVKTNGNSGIPKNLNNGVVNSEGEWIKIIAGDDILHSDCISTYVEFVQKFDNNKCLFHSNILQFKDLLVPNYSRINEKNKDLRFDVFYWDSNKPLEGPDIKTCTIFFSRMFINEIGGFDERFKLIEDGPLFFKTLTRGYPVVKLEFESVSYRIHSSSVLRNYSNRKFNIEYAKSKYESYYLLSRNFTPKIIKFFKDLDYLRFKTIIWTKGRYVRIINLVFNFSTKPLLHISKKIKSSKK